jgi:cytidine deaminase
LDTTDESNLVLNYLKIAKMSSNKDDGATSQEDAQDIKLAHRYRLSLATSPTQSSFRVVAIVFYRDSCEATASSSNLACPVADNQSDSRQYVVGTNDEPGGFIGGSICAERAALVQLRFLPNAKVTKIVIVTDHEKPISPGMLCREFMAGHSSVPWDVPMLLAGTKRGSDVGYNTTKTTLRQLYPYPSPYARLTASQANDVGNSFNGAKTEKRTSLSTRAVEQLMTSARKSSLKDNLTKLHPIQFGAAVLFDDDTIVVSHQKKALEYGASLDAVTQLVPLLEQSSAHPLALVQVDSFGLAHAPFAPARAYLSEHGYGDCRVLIHSYNQDDTSTDGNSAIFLGKIVDVPASYLAPDAPEMGDLWGC